MTGEQALEVQTLFRGVVIGTKYVVAPTRRRPLSRASTFVIGASARADAPVGAAFLRHLGEEAGGGHALIGGAFYGDGDADVGDDGAGGGAATGTGTGYQDSGGNDAGTGVGDGYAAPYAITLAPGMTGTIYDGARTRHVRSPADGATPGPCVALPPGARAQLTCGAITFLVARTERPPALRAAPFPWLAAENRYHLLASLGVAMVLWMLLSVSGDPRTLALDVFPSERGLVKFVIKPPVDLAVDARGVGRVAEAAGRPGRAAKGPSGAMGTETSRDRNRAYARQGVLAVRPPQPSAAPAPIDPRQAGVLGVFQQVLEQSPAAREVLAAPAPASTRWASVASAQWGSLVAETTTGRTTAVTVSAGSSRATCTASVSSRAKRACAAASTARSFAGSSAATSTR